MEYNYEKIEKDYTKMCEKAYELQDRKKQIDLNKGDYIYMEGRIELALHWFMNNKLNLGQGMNRAMNRDFIWIPTQQQLQELIFRKDSWNYLDDGTKYRNVVSRTIKEFSEFYSKNIEIVHGFEFVQIWLAFAMYDIYRKTWNKEKEEWEEIK